MRKMTIRLSILTLGDCPFIKHARKSIGHSRLPSVTRCNKQYCGALNIICDESSTFLRPRAAKLMDFHGNGNYKRISQNTDKLSGLYLFSDSDNLLHVQYTPACSLIMLWGTHFIVLVHVDGFLTSWFRE